MKTYAEENEWVTCEQGHKIACFRKTVLVGEPFEKGNLIDWQQPEPELGAPIPPCEKCGALWHAPGVGMILHFEDGWRGMEGKKSE